MIERAIRELKGNPEEAAIEYTKRLSSHLQDFKQPMNELVQTDSKLSKLDNFSFDQSKTVNIT